MPDYGMGKTNIDHKTGIRYGVIPVDDVLQAWADSSEPEYADETEQMCGECQKMHEGNVGDLVECECGEEFELELSDFAEPMRHVLNDGEYEATQSADDTDIFITKSPYFTFAAFCSPCAPGACHLRNPLEPEPPFQAGQAMDSVIRHMSQQNNRCYCFGHDWFDEGKAPYTVFSVETNRVVLPDGTEEQDED